MNINNNNNNNNNNSDANNNNNNNSNNNDNNDNNDNNSSNNNSNNNINDNINSTNNDNVPQLRGRPPRQAADSTHRQADGKWPDCPKILPEPLEEKGFKCCFRCVEPQGLSSDSEQLLLKI